MRTFGFIRSELEKDGFKETPPGVFELRDWEEILTWIKNLRAKRVNS